MIHQLNCQKAPIHKSVSKCVRDTIYLKTFSSEINGVDSLLVQKC